jgi:transcriptional regulator with XRE-family HTH domain
MVGRDIRTARRLGGLSIREAASHVGISESQWSRLERGLLRVVNLGLVCRAARAVGLELSLKLYLAGSPVRDKASLAILDRFALLLGRPLRLQREVVLPGARDLRAWDGRIEGDERPGSTECESHLEDIQALARRIALKQRDDPGAGVVILVLNRTAHNRRVLAEHREALRLQFPMDGAAIARELRAGRVPRASGIILV